MADVISRQDFFKTHQEWRDILSGTLFVKEKQPGTEYLLRFFWRASPKLIFGDSDDRDASTRDFAPTLIDGTRLRPEDFCDSNPLAFGLKRLICYNVILTHMKFQFEETDDAFLRNMEFTAGQKAQRRLQRSTLFHSDNHIPKDCPPWEHPDLAVKSLWFEQFRGFIRHWPVVGSHTHPHLTDKLTGIDHESFARAVNELFIVYYSGVIRVLHVVPTILWTFPGTEGLGHYLSI
jgi:hypothetical protein